MYISPLDFAMKQTLLDIINESSMPIDKKKTMNRFIKEEMTQDQAHILLYGEPATLHEVVRPLRVISKHARDILNRMKADISKKYEHRVGLSFWSSSVAAKAWFNKYPTISWVKVGIASSIILLSTAAYLVYYYALSKYATKCQDQKGFDKQLCILKAKAAAEEETIRALKTAKTKCGKDKNPGRCRENHDKLIEKHEKRRKNLLNRVQKLFDRV